jgi:DNA-binding MarR family transcriptional regulator
VEPTDSPELLGDLLAQTRRAWIAQMAAGLSRRGFEDYRRSDALVFRVLRRGPLPVGRLATLLGTSRQAGRKVVDGLEQRGYATTGRDGGDARRTTVALTPLGERYASAVVEVIDELHRGLAAQVRPDELESARTVLRTVIAGGGGPDPGP